MFFSGLIILISIFSESQSMILLLQPISVAAFYNGTSQPPPPLTITSYRAYIGPE